jgi:hypothetical protein
LDNCKNQVVIGQWPELALTGTMPDMATRKPPAASTAVSAAILKAQCLISPPPV